MPPRPRLQRRLRRPEAEPETEPDSPRWLIPRLLLLRLRLRLPLLLLMMMLMMLPLVVHLVQSVVVGLTKRRHRGSGGRGRLERAVIRIIRSGGGVGTRGSAPPSYLLPLPALLVVVVPWRRSRGGVEDGDGGDERRRRRRRGR